MNWPFVHNKETNELLATFNSKAADARAKVSRLKGILDGLTSETCPLSPCDDCILIRCMLRRTKSADKNKHHHNS